MRKIGGAVFWAYIIISMIAFVRIIIVGDSVIDSIIGTGGIVALNLAVWAILGSEDE